MCIIVKVSYRHCVAVIVHQEICLDHIAHTWMQKDNEPCPKTVYSYRVDQNWCGCMRSGGPCTGEENFEKGHVYTIESKEDRDKKAKRAKQKERAEKERLAREQRELEREEERREKVIKWKADKEKKRRRLAEAAVNRETNEGSMNRSPNLQSSFGSIHHDIDDFNMEDVADMENPGLSSSESNSDYHRVMNEGDLNLGASDSMVTFTGQQQGMGLGQSKRRGRDPWHPRSTYTGDFESSPEDSSYSSFGIPSSDELWNSNPNLTPLGSRKLKGSDDIPDAMSTMFGKNPSSTDEGGFKITGEIKEDDQSGDFVSFASLTNDGLSPKKGDWDTQAFVNGENRFGEYNSGFHGSGRRSSFDPSQSPSTSKNHIGSDPSTSTFGAFDEGGVAGISSSFMSEDDIRLSARGLEPDLARNAAELKRAKNSLPDLPDHDDSGHSMDINMED